MNYMKKESAKSLVWEKIHEPIQQPLSKTERVNVNYFHSSLCDIDIPDEFHTNI
jgi:hypothetical protein